MLHEMAHVPRRAVVFAPASRQTFYINWLRPCRGTAPHTAHSCARAHGDLGLGASSSRLRVTLCHVGALNTQDTPASLSKRSEAAAAVALGVVGSVHETRGTEPAEPRVPGAELEQRGLRGLRGAQSGPSWWPEARSSVTTASLSTW